MFKNERRVFRGRGGPTDRRLPKHNARRRRKHPPEGGAPEEGQSAEADAACPLSRPPASACEERNVGLGAEAGAVIETKNEAAKRTLVDSVFDGHHEPVHSVSGMSSPENLLAGEAGRNRDDDGAMMVIVAEICKVESAIDGPPPAGDDDDDDGAVCDRGTYQAEAEHLRARIRNAHRAMSSLGARADSPAEAATPSAVENYQRHALDATRNAIREYRSILRRYHGANSVGEAMGCDESEDEDGLHRRAGLVWNERQQVLQEDRKELGAEIVGLTQQALQCGPLAGSKAGYMKRCGCDVASRVLRFLHDAFPDDDDDGTNAYAFLGWTEKQAQAARAWKRSAERAAAGGKQ